MTSIILALKLLCPSQVGLAEYVDEAARRYMVPPAVLVALMHAESRCNPRAVNRRTGAVGLMQILPKKSANPRRYSTAKLMRPRLNIMLGARHLSRMRRLCGNIEGALHVYHGYRKCAGWEKDDFVTKVMANSLTPKQR